ncbi:hypothetical protein NC651_019049 [Populus alba x Populus x berolinensis]|nr:hypothetical protein NC651_019049 [Populus alba x Populus x berolinensis]
MVPSSGFETLLDKCAHYRSPLSYSVLQLEGASDAVFYIYQTLQDCEEALLPFQAESLKDGSGQNGNMVAIAADAQRCISRLREELETKMSDDLNTSPLLTGAFQEALMLINSSLGMLKKKQQLSLIRSLTEIKKEVTEVLKILGHFPPRTCAEVRFCNFLFEDRAVARKSHDFKKSDQIRTDLVCKGHCTNG